jgi:flagellar biosynthesis/type III secretory pathway M-ring protein FliF/YscJ
MRGDRVEIASVPFQTEPRTAGEGLLGGLARSAPTVLVRLAALAFVAAVLLYGVRPLLLSLAARASERRREMPQAAADQLTQENLALTQQHPERAAQLVREWLRESTTAVEG